MIAPPPPEAPSKSEYYKAVESAHNIIQQIGSYCNLDIVPNENKQALLELIVKFEQDVIDKMKLSILATAPR